MATPRESAFEDALGGAFADMVPWRTWPAAATAALRFLEENTGWDVWTVTRVIDGRQIVLCAAPADVVRPGTSYPWEDTFCKQMVSGQAPRVATVAAAVPEYASRMPDSEAVGVAAYLGVPLVDRRGRLFGTVCALGFRARPISAARDLPLAEFVARLLSSLLAAGLDPGPIPTDARDEVP